MADRYKKAHEAILSLAKELEVAIKTVDNRRIFTSAFSNWINSFEDCTVHTEERKSTRAEYLFQVRYYFQWSIRDSTQRSFLREMEDTGYGHNKKDAYEQCFKKMIKRLLSTEMKGSEFTPLWEKGELFSYGETQMDFAENGEIDGEQVADREGNVILEVDDQADDTKVVNVSASEICKKLASTEKPFDMIGDGYSMMNRWYPLQKVKIDENTSELFSLRIPEALYSDKTSVNLLPLKGFIYGDLDLEFKLVLNSAPFHCGRIIMGVFYCPQGYNKSFQKLDGVQVKVEDNTYVYKYTTVNTEILSIYGMVQRPHVMLDLGQSSSANLLVKYNYNKPFVRLLDYSKNTQVNPGVTGGYFVNLKANMLTPLRTADDNPKYVNCTLYYRFVKANLTGMTRQHDLTQMDALGGLLGEVLDTGVGGLANTGKSIIDTVERQLTRKGKVTTNRDKPSLQFNTDIVIPRPRNHFPNGVGLADPIIMGMDVKSLTSQYEKQGYGPTSYLEYAKIPGIDNIFQWKLTDEGSIFSETVQPYATYLEPQFGQDGTSNLCKELEKLPLHIASNGFMYWAGTIVYEFDFVKTAFHKGSIMISVSYGKEPDNNTVGSNYEKIVDIQDTSKIRITVPYIYDTIARRTNNNSYITTWPQPGNWHTDALPTYNRTQIKLVVMNPLIDIGSVSNQIDVIVWKYAGEDFYLSGNCQVNNFITYKLAANDPLREIPEFPRTKYPGDLTTATSYLANLPHTQMDYEDFKPGPIDNARMHTGDETSFKNLLRIPIRIVFNQRVESGQAYCLPVVPLTVELMRYYLSETSRLTMTHQSQIVKMFRMWRGTLRYTIVATSINPIYVTYLPPDGTWKKEIRPKYFNERIETVNGKQINYNKITNMPGFFDATNKTDLSGTGNYTTLLVPNVNPTEQLEVPWNLPVNWALMNQDNLRTQACYRDISYSNNGHLVFYSDMNFNFSVFLSVGDDFEMGAFCGLTDTLNISRGIRMDDARYKTQMDFQSNELSSDDELMYYSCVEEQEDNKILKGARKYWKPIVFAASHLMPQPISDITKAFLYAHTLGSISNKFEQVEEAAKNLKVLSTPEFVRQVAEVPRNTNRVINKFEKQTLHKVDGLLDGCCSITDATTNFIGLVQSEGVGGLCEWFFGKFGFADDGVFSSIKNILKYLYDAIISLDIRGVVNYLLDSLVAMGMLCSNFVKRKLALIREIMCRCLTSVLPEFLGQTQSLTMQNELDSALFSTNDYQTLIGLILGGVLTVCGSKNTSWQNTFREDQSSWINQLMSIKFVSGTNSCMAFVKNIYDIVSRMIFKVMGQEDEEFRIKQLLSSKGGVVSEFVKNAQLFLNDFNNENIADVVEKSKFWITICNAYQIRACLAKIKGDSATSVLKSICKEVITKANENASLFKATSVRYEPWVVCFEGDTGIGKSFLTSQASADILTNLGLKMKNIDYRYNVSAGVDYWNLYNGQPIIIYDDWCNLVDTQSIRKEISELYQLKTSNVMNAPKAELSEKKTVVNPFAVLLATNNPFPKTTTLVDTKPLYRRRDMLVKVQLKPGVDRTKRDSFENFGHLMFGIYDDVTEAQHTFDWLNFEDFRKEMLNRHAKYHKNESENVKKRIEILSQVLEEQALVNQDIADPFTLQARSLYEMERISEEKGVVKSLPSEMLEYQVRNIIDLISEKYKLVKTNEHSFIIEDKDGDIQHNVPLSETQGLLSFGKKYFVTPVITSINVLYEYLSKWINMGMHCNNCLRSAVNSGIVLKCESCSKILCGFCVGDGDERGKCQCGANMFPYCPKYLDLIIGFVVQSVTSLTAPSNWKSILAAKLVNLFYKVDVGVPMLIINFFTNILRVKQKKEHSSECTIKIRPIAKTQVNVDEFPKEYSICKITGDGNCLINAVGKGLLSLGLLKGKLRDLIELVEKKHRRNEKGWFDSETHGRYLAEKFGVTIHLMEKNEKVEGGYLHSLIDRDGVRQVDFDFKSIEAVNMVHIINEGNDHFDAILYTKSQESVVPLVEEPIKMRPLSSAKSKIKRESVMMPKDWWFESALRECEENLTFCKHEGIKDKLEEDIDFELSENQAELVDGTIWPFSRCNKECELSVTTFKALVERYFHRNKLTMEEHLGMVDKGLCELDEIIIPKIYQPKWIQLQVDKSVESVTSEESWIVTLARSIVKASFLGGVFALVVKSFRLMTGFVTSILGSLASVFFGGTQWIIESPTGRGSNYIPKDKRQQRRARAAAKGKDKTQGSMPDSEHYTNIKDKICQNYVFIKTDKVKQMIGLGIFGSKILIPKHYIKPLQQSKEIILSFANVKHETQKLNPRNLEIEFFKDKDCAILSVSKAIYFADIRKFFHNMKDFEDFQEQRGEIIVPKVDECMSTDIRFQGILPLYEAWDDFSGTIFRTAGAIEYNYEQRGACGSVLLSKEKNRPIIGIHIAGHAGINRGTGARICAEELEFENPLQFSEIPYPMEEEGILDFGEDVNVEYIGKLDKELTPFLPNKSNIEKSLINDHFDTPNKMQPAILSAKDPRYIHKDASPLIYGVKKHGKPTIDFDDDLVKRASSFWRENLLQFKWTFSNKVQIYDIKTATLGLAEDSEYYDWLPDSTSAGWPYNTYRKEGESLKTQKKHWLYYERDPVTLRPVDVVFNEVILKDIERDMNLRRRGILAPVVFQDVLKDEKRPIEKLMKPGGTRVFSMSPVTASIVLRQYTLDLTSYLRKNRISNWIGIGINPDGPEWGKIVTRLRAKGDNIFSIDFSNFGPGLNVNVVYEFYHLMQDFYGRHLKLSEEDNNVMRCLIQELMYSVHLAGGTLYRTKSGSPSGAAITVEINSFVHLMYINICWQIIGKAIRLFNKGQNTVEEQLFLDSYKELLVHLEESKIDLDLYADMDANNQEFVNNVVGVVYGDDGIFSVRDEFAEVFNAATIQIVLRAHGICATDASKGDVIKPYGPLNEMTFLKRSFVPHPVHRNEWLAPIDVTSIEECARWIRKGVSADLSTMENAHASLLLCYGHGEKEYESWRRKLNEFLKLEDLEPIFLTWENVDMMFYPEYYHGKPKTKEMEVFLKNVNEVKF
ncbi:polyprotein [Vespa velutina associated ifla-like virus]|nr:polyprotein [Vespa velutina associated ifla-like virus]